MLASLCGLLCLCVLDAAGIAPGQGGVGPVVTFLVTGIPFLSLVMVCVSQEKVEDEYIQSLRARAVLAVVVYAFVVNMVAISFNRVFLFYLPLETCAAMHNITYLCTNVPLMALIYLVIFKGSLLINRLKACDDRQ